MTGLGDTRQHSVTSTLLERPFHVFVRLPESYGETEERLYPTVYLLDGGITFPLLGAYYHYLWLADDVPDAILVGISYGGRTHEEGNFRGTDFTAPSAEREHYGGAARFQEVLRREILPFVEGEYRSDTERRVIFGQSLGGQFALFTAQTDPTLFWGHIASNPALHRNLPFFLATGTELSPAGGGVFVSSASDDDPRFKVPAEGWIEAWTAREVRPWDLEVIRPEGENHFSAAPEAFRRGMLWLFDVASE